MNPSKAKGTSVESALVSYAGLWGFPEACRIALAGANDKGDVSLGKDEDGNLAIAECKYAGKRVMLSGWIRETLIEVTNAGALVGILVAKQPYAGTASMGRWFTAMTVEHWEAIDGPPVDTLPSWSGASINPSAVGRPSFVGTILGKGCRSPEPGDMHTVLPGGLHVINCVKLSGAPFDRVVAGPLWQFMRMLRIAGFGLPVF
jgi:hypothetical protein